MAKIKNISGEDRLVPGLNGRLVVAGQVVDLDRVEVTGYTQQEQIWSPADDDAQAEHDEMLQAIAYLRALDLPEPTDADVAALLTIALTELGYRDVIDNLVPQLDPSGLLVLLDIERAGKDRSTVRAAAETRLAHLGHPVPVEVPGEEGVVDATSPGDAVDADTGEVTTAGQPLPAADPGDDPDAVDLPPADVPDDSVAVDPSTDPSTTDPSQEG